MKKVIKNSVTGLYNLKIDNRVFESEYDNSFAIQVEEIESLLIQTIPLGVIIELKTPEDNPALKLIRVIGDLIHIILFEFGDWEKSLCMSEDYYYKLKEEIIKNSSFPDEIEFDDIARDNDLFEYTIRFSALTVGEAFQRAMKIYNYFDSRMIQVDEQGATYMSLLARRSFQIDVSHIFSGKDSNSKV